MQELLKAIESKKEELNALDEQELGALHEQEEYMESLSSDAQRILDEQKFADLPDEITDDSLPEEQMTIEDLDVYDKYAYPKSKLPIVCPVDGEKFNSVKEFIVHWDSTHIEKYGVYKVGAYPKAKPYENPSKDSEEMQEDEIKEEPKEDPKTEPKKPLTIREATELWMQKKTRRTK